MSRLVRPGAAALLFFLALVSGSAAETARFARTPDISPDGRWVAFSYLGDLWIVEAGGGQARHLTMHESHDFNPVFSPDGKSIAFSSNRHGHYDVFVIPVEGGRPNRLTHDSAEDHPTGWTPDGKNILFMSTRDGDFPHRVELYSVPVTGGLARRISVHEGRDGAYSPHGNRIAYARGPGSWFRKGYHGSSNDDIWICDADGSNNRQITRHDGQDDYPQWSPDGRSLYFVSDCFGVANVVRLDCDPEQALPRPDATPVAVTRQKEDRVRRMRLCRNGEFLVYECGPDIWVHSLKDNTSRKLGIEVHADDKVNPEKVSTLTSGATEFSLSSDEKHIAFVVHGEVFIMPRAGGKAKQITDNPAFDHGVSWSPDSRKLLFLSDRSGDEDVYLVESDDPDHAELSQAHKFKVKQLTKTAEPEVGASFAPDGSRIAFIRSGKLWTMAPDGSGEKVLVSDGQVFDYEWSPDARWICYARSDSHFASELFIVPAAGPTPADPARNITRFATYNGGVTWSRAGNTLAFISQRRRDLPSAYVLSLHKSQAAGTAAGKDFDWDDMYLRVKQPVSMVSTECAISNDGTKLAFRATLDGDDLWVASADGSQIARLTTGNTRPTQIQWSRYFSSQLYFRDHEGHIRTTIIGAATGASPSVVVFQARLLEKQDDLFTEMFDQSWRTVNETFYDATFHGADWRQVRERFRPLVKHCVLKEDLYALITLMLGELNASHLGIGGSATTADQQTADLGLLFDRGYRGPGLKIAEVLRNGPCDLRGQVKAGDVLLRIDGTALDESVDVSRLLNDKVGEAVSLQVSAKPGEASATRRVEVQGASRSAVSQLLYERWVAHNAQRVWETSGGKLGYIHIPSMDEAGLERFLRALFSDAFDKEGIVLDVRYNGGG